MAHFAKLDENNIVLEVHVVNNETLDSSNEEESGIEFLTEWSGGYSNWKQTSYNATFRKNYAAPNFKYDEELDAFIPPKPYESWILNEDICRWDPPTPYPEDEDLYSWDESKKKWTKVL
jgi:hypothetical protein